MTSRQSPTHDLFVLTADSHQRAGVEALLATRTRDLGIRPISCEVQRHPRSDPGVYGEAADFLRPFLHTHCHALVVIDAAWEGAPAPARIQSSIQGGLDRNGWSRRSAVVVIDPEVEVWCWVESPAVEAATGLKWATLRRLGTEEGLWQSSSPKPSAPKELLRAALRKSRSPTSATLYADLARSLPLCACMDPAFVALRETLREWFSAHPTGAA